MADVYMKQGATLPKLRVTLTKRDLNGSVVPVVLTTANGVTLRLTNQKTGKVRAGLPVADVDFANGVGEWAPVAGDTDERGDYNVEVVVDWDGAGTVEVFPSQGYETLTIG